jgi:hypothetical protein
VHDHKKSRRSEVETLGTALLTNEIPESRAVTATVSRDDIAEALKDPESSPELFLDLDRGGERSTVAISWSYGELAHLFESARGDDVTFAFDAEELEWAFADVEAHGLREKALVFTVAVAGALGSGATIANAAPTIERGSDGAASVATVQALATDSIATTGGITSNAHTPGLQTGDAGSAASAAAIKLSTEPRPAVADERLASNVHTPGVQLGPGESTAAASSASRSVAKAADDAVVSNAHRPGVQIGPEQSTAAAPSANVSVAKAADDAVVSNAHRPGIQIGPEQSGADSTSVKVSGGTSDGEFLGVDTRDATEALIAGGVLLAIAGATFAGTRRPGSARPA